jgi:ubiquinone/menaquinone biosynthesis C-methylase UbiE
MKETHMTHQPDETLQSVMSYYSSYDEQDRLAGGWGQVEYVRTQSILRRYLQTPPAVVLDVGGAAGRYACWLAREGYQVHLVDPVPLHIQQAQAASAAQPETPIASCRLGDARRLEFDAGQTDVILLMGPLYHLAQAQDRRLALREAYRVLKPGGILFAAGISRFASTIDGLMSGYWLDPPFREIMRRDLQDGQHRNPTQNPAYFTDSFFHHPEELEAEVAEVGFAVQALLAVEGISYMTKDLAQNWAMEDRRAFLLELIQKIEQEPSLIGASPHIMCVATKPE